MTSDEYLTSLRSDWRGSAPDSANIMRSFRRHQWWRRRTLAITVTGVATIAGCLVWATWMALHGREFYVIPALAFGVGLPIVTMMLVRVRSSFAVAHQASPYGMVLQMRERISLEQRHCDAARWSAAILLLSAITAWVVAEFGLIGIRSVMGPSAAWSITALLLWIWQGRQMRRLRDRKELCDQLIAEFDAAKS